jgi:hypothetical protein
MAFCSLDEAFMGPQMGAGAGAGRAGDTKSSKKKKHREGFAPGPLASLPDPDRPAAPPPPTNDILSGPPVDRVPAESAAGVNLEGLFPMPGETGDVEEWEKAFTLEGSRLPPPAAPPPPIVRADGSLSVAGQPTLWRQIASPLPASASAAVNTVGALASAGVDKLSAVPTEINRQLENLTRQLESLTTPTPLQGTAELFLFVAIGLLILLAIDTMLRFAVSLSERRIMAGGAYAAAAGAGWR